MADSVHIRSFCAQASRKGCFGRLRVADVNAVTIRRPQCLRIKACCWLVIDSSRPGRAGTQLAGPPSGWCSACGDLLVDDATVAGIAFRWGFTNLGRFARDYQDLFGETPSVTRRRPTL